MKSKIVEANEKIAEEVTSGFSKIQDGVVNGYKRIEDGVVEGFSKIEESFINRYLKRDGESVAEAKERLQKEARKHTEQNSRR